VAEEGTGGVVRLVCFVGSTGSEARKEERVRSGASGKTRAIPTALPLPPSGQHFFLMAAATPLGIAPMPVLPAGAHTWNELPQPQVDLTCGLLNLKPAPSSVST